MYIYIYVVVYTKKSIVYKQRIIWFMYGIPINKKVAKEQDDIVAVIMDYYYHFQHCIIFFFIFIKSLSIGC